MLMWKVGRLGGKMKKYAPTRVVAVPWYPDPISYRSARHLMVDKDRLPVSFARWLEAALHYVQRLQAQGYVVEKVMIVPSQFREWAMRTGHDHDADGRARFAAVMLDRLRLARAL
jgi:hypothetical protein